MSDKGKLQNSEIRNDGAEMGISGFYEKLSPNANQIEES